jgi:uncharacterized protein (TIGR02246 family)
MTTTSAVNSSGQPVANVRVAAELRSRNQAFSAALAAGDAVGVAALYTDDAQLLPAGGPTAVGRPAVETFWAGAMAAGMTAAELVTTTVTAAGPTAWETGQAHLTLTGPDGSAQQVVRYLVVWCHDAGQWRIAADCWNSDHG